jgi:hypothetical protein
MRLTKRTKPRGPRAATGLMLEMMGMVCSTALARKTMLERRRNCRMRHFGTKVISVYLAVKTQLLFSYSSTLPN